MNQHDVITNNKTYDPSLSSNQISLETNNKTYDPTLLSKQYNVPQDGYFDWHPIYYAFLKRVIFIEGQQCLQNSLNKLSKNI